MFVFTTISLWAQKEIVGYDGISKMKYEIFEGVISTLLFQSDSIINVDRCRYPEYFDGLPESFMESLSDGKYTLFNDSPDSTNQYLRQTWFIKNHLIDSVWIGYRKTGDIEFRYEYRNGKKHGKQLKWEYGNNIMTYWNMSNDTVNGQAFFYDIANRNFKQGEFLNGERIGKWISFYTIDSKEEFYIEEIFDENCTITKTFKEGKLIETIEY